MSNRSIHLNSTHFIDYVYIMLFIMFNKSIPIRSVNSILKELLDSLHSSLGTPSISCKSISRYRFKLTSSFASNFLPSVDITARDSFSLDLVLTTIASAFDLSLPDNFFTDVSSSIAVFEDQLTGLSDPVLSFFSSLTTRTLSPSFDLLIILTTCFEYMSMLHPSWYPDCFTQLRSSLLKTTMVDTFNISFSFFERKIYSTGQSENESHSVPPENNFIIQNRLQAFFNNNPNFVLISADKSDPYRIHEFGECSFLIPSFEIELRQLFNFKTPSNEFRSFIVEIIGLLISDRNFRISLRDLLTERKDQIGPSANKVMA